MLSQDMLNKDAPNVLQQAFWQNANQTIQLDLDPDIFAIIVGYMRGHVILPFAPTIIPKHLTVETFRLALLEDARRLQLFALERKILNEVKVSKAPQAINHELIHYALVDGLLVGRLRLRDLRESGGSFKTHGTLGVLHNAIPTKVKDQFGHTEAVLELHATFATVRFWAKSPLNKVLSKAHVGMPILEPLVSVRFETQEEEDIITQIAGKQSTIAGVPAFPLPYNTVGLHDSDRTNKSPDGNIHIAGNDNERDRRRHSSAQSRGWPIPHAQPVMGVGIAAPPHPSFDGRGIGGSAEMAAAWDFEMQLDGHTYTLRELLIFAQCLEAVNAATQKAVYQSEDRNTDEAANNIQQVKMENRVKFSPTSTAKSKSRRFSLHGPAAAAAAGVPNASKDAVSGSPPRMNPFLRVFGGSSPSSSSSSDKENASNGSQESSATSVSKGPTALPTSTTAEPSVGALSIAKETLGPVLSTAITTGLILGLNYAESLRISEIMDTDIDASELIFRVVFIPGEQHRTLRLIKLVGTTKKGALYKTPFLADRPQPDGPTKPTKPIAISPKSTKGKARA